MKLNKIVLPILFGVFFVSQIGCSSPNIHKNSWDDSKILIRKWVMSTHGTFEAGDKGAEYSNPVVAGNTLVFGNQSIGLISLYPIMQQVRWVLPIQGGVFSELLVHEGTIYFGGGDGFLYAVDLESGKVLWRYEVRSTLLSKPTISDDRIFVTSSNDTVFAFEAETGKWLWHYRRRTAQSATIHAASSPFVDKGEVIVGMSDGYVVSLASDTGSLIWQTKIHRGSKFTDVDASPVMKDDIVYVPSYDGALYALNRKNGAVSWRFDSGGSKRIELENDIIYLPSSEGTIYTLNKDTGKVNWKFELDGGTPTRIILTDSYVIFGSSMQYLYVLEKDTGKLLYRYNVGYESGFSGSPVFNPVTNRLYFLSGAGNLYAFSLRQSHYKQFPRVVTDPYIFFSSRKDIRKDLYYH